MPKLSHGSVGASRPTATIRCRTFFLAVALALHRRAGRRRGLQPRRALRSSQFHDYIVIALAQLATIRAYLAGRERIL